MATMKLKGTCIPSNPSPQLSSVLVFLQGWIDLDMAAVVSVLVDEDEGLQYTVGPPTMELPTMHSKAYVQQFFEMIFVERTQTYSIEVLDIIESDTSNRIFVRSHLHVVTTLNSEMSHYSLWTFTFESTPSGKPGTRVSALYAFTDSQSITDLFLKEDRDYEPDYEGEAREHSTEAPYESDRAIATLKE